MKLEVKCPDCKKEFYLKKKYNTRPDLVSEIGEYFRIECTHCYTSNEFHANDVKAVESLAGSVIGTVVGIIVIAFVTLLFWNQGFVTNLGLILGGGIIIASNYSTYTSNTKAFNSYRIKRNPK